MNCLYFTSDLMFTSRVKPVAQEMGALLKFPGFEQIDFDSKPDLVIFDLEFVGKEELKGLMENLFPCGVTTCLALSRTALT